MFSCSVMFNSLQSHGLQHTRLPCPSLSPGVCSNSCPLSQWCHPTILSSVVPFSSCLQSFPASGGNSRAGLPLPPLALFVVMFPKAHLTSHSRTSGSRWVIIPSQLSGSWRSFLYSSSVYCFHLFYISSASVRSIPFLSFIVSIFCEMFPWYLWFSWKDL